MVLKKGWANFQSKLMKLMHKHKKLGFLKTLQMLLKILKKK